MSNWNFLRSDRQYDLRKKSLAVDSSQLHVLTVLSSAMYAKNLYLEITIFFSKIIKFTNVHTF